MKINSITQSYMQPLKNAPAFKSKYEINGDSISSRQQVFTMGMLMSNFWIRDSRNTFFDVKRKYVYGKFVINVNDMRDNIVEKILKNNNIEFRKLDNK